MRDHAWAAAVAILFAAWCVAFAAATPYRTPGVLLGQRDPQTGAPIEVPDVGAPDERQHANYAMRLLEGEGLPVLRPGDFEGYQAHQPPLYYALLAGWCKLTGARLDDPGSGLLVRLPNILVGLLTLAGVYCGARWAGMGAVGAATATTLILMPMVVALHAAVSNDPLLYCLVAWCLALLVRATGQGWGVRDAALVGAVAGLSLLAKTSAVVLLPAVVLAWLLTSRDLRRPQGLALALGVAALLAVPWWARNVSLYGDALALRAFEEAFANSPKAATFVAALGPAAYWGQMVGWWTARSLVGAFGYMDIFMLEAKGSAASGAFYVRALAALALPFAGWARRPSEEEGRLSRNAAWLALALVVLVLLSFVRFNSTYFQGQGRYLYPALAGIAWLWGEGLVRLVRRPALAFACALAVMLVLDGVAWGSLTEGFGLRLRPAGPGAL